MPISVLTTPFLLLLALPTPSPPQPQPPARPNILLILVDDLG